MRASWTMLLASGPLALWGAWALWVSVPHGHWVAGVLGGVALVTAGGLLLLQAWARPLTYLFAAWLVLGWFYAVGQVISRGWPYADWLQRVLSLVPGACVLIVCTGGSWVVHNQYRRHVLSNREHR
jgi:hypothetical protein